MAPFAINQIGSVLYYVTIGQADISSITNSLTFLVTSIAGRMMGERAPTITTYISVVLYPKLCFPATPLSLNRACAHLRTWLSRVSLSRSLVLHWVVVIVGRLPYTKDGQGGLLVPLLSYILVSFDVRILRADPFLYYLYQV